MEFSLEIKPEGDTKTIQVIEIGEENKNHHVIKPRLRLYKDNSQDYEELKATHSNPINDHTIQRFFTIPNLMSYKTIKYVYALGGRKEFLENYPTIDSFKQAMSSGVLTNARQSLLVKEEDLVNYPDCNYINKMPISPKLEVKVFLQPF